MRRDEYVSDAITLAHIHHDAAEFIFGCELPDYDLIYKFSSDFLDEDGVFAIVSERKSDSECWLTCIFEQIMVLS